MKINWLIHFGGDPGESVFSGEIVEFLGRTQFMESLYGGGVHSISYPPSPRLRRTSKFKVQSFKF